MRKIITLSLSIILLTSLTACAAKDVTLTLYTSMKESLVLVLIEDFEEQNPGITVDVRIDGAGALMELIESERAAGRIEADMLWTSEIPDFYQMKDEGLLMQYRPVGADEVYNSLEETEDYFIGARLGTMGIAYNTDIISTPPSSWTDLFGPEYTDSFAVANPLTSGTAMMAVVLLNEALGPDFFKALSDNGAYIGGGSTAVVDAVARGEAAACLAVDYIAYDKIDSGSPMAISYPPEMIVIPSPMAIFKDSGQAAAAKKFADYLLSAAAQEQIATKGTLPVMPGIAVPDKYNIPTASEAAVRAIVVNEAEILGRQADVLAMFMEIME